MSEMHLSGAFRRQSEPNVGPQARGNRQTKGNMSTNAPAPIDPSHAALLVMDYQNGIVGMVENSDELLAIARNLIRTFREHGGTVGYVRVGFADGDLDNVPGDQRHGGQRSRRSAAR